VIARLSTGPLGMPMSSCSTNTPGTLVVTGSAYGKELVLNSFSVVVGAGTDYDATKGTVATKFSFKGVKPGESVAKNTANAAVKLESKIFAAHTQDYQRLMGGFRLELADPWKNSQYPSESLDFYSLLDRYKFSANGGTGARKQKRAALNSKLGKSDSQLAKMAQPIVKRQTQFAPTRVAMQEKWESVTTAAPFPDFDFPKTLAKGVTVTGPVPWSTDGVITVTGQNGAKQTITLTSAPVSRVTGEAIPERITIPEPEAMLTQEPARTPEFVWEIEDTTDGSRAIQDVQDAQQATGGDPYVEALLFDLARHLFISSSRDDSLPPTLQGRWTERLDSSLDGYRSNINLQMNHWFADQVGLGDLQDSLFNFMKNTWMPRGKETARLVYGAPGWVAHEEMNIFGHTGLKSKASCEFPRVLVK
jgi:hypothetical protein